MKVLYVQAFFIQKHFINILLDIKDDVLDDK